MKKSSIVNGRAGAEQQLATNYLWIAIAYFCTAQISKFQPKIVSIFSRMNRCISDLFHRLCRILHFFCEFLMKFYPHFATNSRKEWRFAATDFIVFFNHVFLFSVRSTRRARSDLLAALNPNCQRQRNQHCIPQGTSLLKMKGLARDEGVGSTMRTMHRDDSHCLRGDDQ